MRGPVVITLGLSLIVIGVIHCHANSESPVNRMTDQSRMFEVLKRDLRQLKRENYHMKRNLRVMKTERDGFKDALAKVYKQLRELKCAVSSDMASPVNSDPSISDLSANLTHVVRALFVDAERMTRSDIAAVNVSLGQELVNAERMTRSEIAAINASLSQELVNAERMARSDITAVNALLSQEIVNAERMTRSDIAAVNASLSQELVNAEKMTRSEIAAINASLNSVLQELVNTKRMTRSDIAAVQVSLSSVLQEHENIASQLVNLVNTTVLCPDEWIQYEGSCYFFPKDEELSWREASKRCQYRDARLVAIETQKEAAFVARVVKRYGGHKSSVWIGANDIETEGQWKWTGTEENVTVSDWSPSQPDDYWFGQDCAYISADFHYKWDDARCKNELDYMCEKRSRHIFG